MQGLKVIAKEIEDDICLQLNKSGMMFRVFVRVKTDMSIQKKLESKAETYKKENKKLQDIIGIRITLYFSDDVSILHQYLRKKSNFVDEMVDGLDPEVFCPQRLNIVMRIPDRRSSDFTSIISDYSNSELIDDTYEIQIRTVLSEGWHEVEHDLRYKCKDDWIDIPTYSRTLNGIYATLETGEWSMLTLFNKMAHEYYKKNNWNAMLRNKMRIRFIDNSLSEECIELLNSMKGIDSVKKFLRTNRDKVCSLLLSDNFRLPVSYDTVLHLINRTEAKDAQLMELESDILKIELDRLFENIVINN